MHIDKHINIAFKNYTVTVIGIVSIHIHIRMHADRGRRGKTVRSFSGPLPGRGGPLEQRSLAASALSALRGEPVENP